MAGRTEWSNSEAGVWVLSSKVVAGHHARGTRKDPGPTFTHLVSGQPQGHRWERCGPERPRLGPELGPR